MKKIILLIAFVALWSAPAAAAQKASAAGQYQLETPFEADVNVGYRWVTQEGNPLSGEYEYLHSSLAGDVLVEYDPLPHRLLFETHALNAKDYLGELDYSYGDVIMVNVLSRSMYHNVYHYPLGTDDPATPSPQFTDYNPGDQYGLRDAMNRFQVRFKTPDFPFHIYLEAKSQNKKGTIQQQFMPAFSSGYNKASRSRDIDWTTEEMKATMNSHLGPVEVEYSHAEKQFSAASGGKVMSDVMPATGQLYTHNLVPDLESSTDTIKIHTSHTGRVAAAATYSSGEKENKDSGAKATFVNAAGDLTLIPWKELTFSLKYRHYEVTENTPNFVTATSPLGATTYSVRNAVSPQTDMVSGTFRYRATQNLTVRGEYAWESLFRDCWEGSAYLPAPPANALAYWPIDQRITKGMLRLGATYRFTNRLLARGDVSRQTADVPANSTDNSYPETTDNVRATLTWSPKTWFNMLLSGGTIREQRDSLASPLAGPKTAERNRALSSFTFLIGKKTSITPSYAFFQNKMDTAVAYLDAAGATIAESGIPYADTSHIASLAVSHAATDVVTVSAEANRSWSRGAWQNSGVVPGSADIPQMTDLKVVTTEFNADVSFRYTKQLGTELRYLYRRLDNILYNTQDGTTQIALATLSLKW